MEVWAKGNTLKMSPYLWLVGITIFVDFLLKLVVGFVDMYLLILIVFLYFRPNHAQTCLWCKACLLWSAWWGYKGSGYGRCEVPIAVFFSFNFAHVEMMMLVQNTVLSYHMPITRLSLLCVCFVQDPTI
jgi:hypothetical protein